MVASSNDGDFDKLLQNFIDSELNEVQVEQIQAPEPAYSKILDVVTQYNLAQEEKALFLAWQNFCNSIKGIADLYKKAQAPQWVVTEDDLYLRYKPSLGEKFTIDALAGWDVMLATYPNQVGTIHPNSSDDQLLDLAEKTSDENLQMAIISYVEILIELEGCDIAYQTRKATAKKKLLEKRIYDEHFRRAEIIKTYIKKIKEKKLPIDAEKLVINYFKTAKKDPDGAWKVLTTNPAVFAPIEIDKIPARFFGLIKTTPKDGFRWNKIIGDFLRKLKV